MTPDRAKEMISKMVPEAKDALLLSYMTKTGLNYSDDEIGQLANTLISGCVRNNTSLEDYHAEWKEFSNDKMKALMIQCCNNMYVALMQLLRTDEDTVRKLFLEQFESKWQKPEIPDWVGEVEKLHENGGIRGCLFERRT